MNSLMKSGYVMGLRLRQIDGYKQVLRILVFVTSNTTGTTVGGGVSRSLWGEITSKEECGRSTPAFCR